MKAMTSDDDARMFSAERNGALSFLSLSADFRTVAELWLADSPMSTSVLNRSVPQASRSVTLADTSVVFEHPNNICLSWSFKWAFNSLSTGAASLSLSDLPDPVMNLLLKSALVSICQLLCPLWICCCKPPAQKQYKNTREVGSYRYH